MYVWNLSGMRETLRASPLPQNEQIKYLLAGTLFSWANGQSPFWGPPRWNLLIGAVQLLVVGAAIYYVYLCNGGRSGERFLERYICLAWVLLVRFFVLVTVPLLAFRDFLYSRYGSGNVMANVVYTSLFIVALLSFYWILARQMRVVSRPAT